MGARLARLPLTNNAKLELEKLRRQPNAKAAVARRAQMILLAAAGHSNAEIARRLHCRPHVVGKWRKSFAAQGVKALEDGSRTGRPVTWTAQESKKVVMTPVASPAKG
jgi:putative transposase